MALGDITLLREGQFGGIGSRIYRVSPSATKINAGEPVAKALGTGVTSGVTVAPLATSKPVVATDYMAGIAATTSTNTATATGTVEVWPLSDETIYLIAPLTAATFNTQTKYDNFVGARVTFDLTSTVYTINETDGATSGLVIEPLDITKYPGKVAFRIRNGVSYTT